MTTVLVLAKSPRPGHSKTRLAPAFGATGAALLAAAALRDTLAAVAAAPARRRVLVLDGDLADAVTRVDVPAGFDVVPQATGTHADRIAAALLTCTGPALLVGMDTPQLTPALLTPALYPGSGSATATGAGAGGPVDAWLGRAEDGGWWALGLGDPGRHAAAALAGVPMSVPWTGAAQLMRLRHLGLRVADLDVLRDVDTPDDAAAVAAIAPETRFARLHRELAAHAATAPGTERHAHA